MPLNFIKSFVGSKNGIQNFLANQPDNSLYQHYVSDKHTPWQVHAKITFADYDSLSWSNPPEVCMTPREVRHIGVKSFPQLGAIGFYRLRYRDLSRVVVPLHPDKEKNLAPVLSLALGADRKILSYTITAPDEKEVDYDCYRIELECNGRTESHVVYELSGELEVPEQKGTFLCHAIGYLQEGQICSKDSNVISLDLPGNPKARNANFADKQKLAEAIANVHIDVDSALDKNSTNPVTNAAVTSAIGDVETVLKNIIGQEE